MHVNAYQTGVVNYNKVYRHHTFKDVSKKSVTKIDEFTIISAILQRGQYSNDKRGLLNIKNILFGFC